MSDTPRTDALIATFKTEGNEFAWLEDLKDLCRELERSARPEVARSTTILPAIWDGSIRFDSDCIINGVEVKAGTVWKAGQTFPSPQLRSQEEK